MPSDDEVIKELKAAGEKVRTTYQEYVNHATPEGMYLNHIPGERGVKAIRTERVFAVAVNNFQRKFTTASFQVDGDRIGDVNKIADETAKELRDIASGLRPKASNEARKSTFALGVNGPMGERLGEIAAHGSTIASQIREDKDNLSAIRAKTAAGPGKGRGNEPPAPELGNLSPPGLPPRAGKPSGKTPR